MEKRENEINENSKPIVSRPKGVRSEKVQGPKSEQVQVILTHSDGRVERRTI